MKRALVLLTLALVALHVSAQPVITVESYPLAGDSYTGKAEYSAPWTPGPDGANQTWDFSAGTFSLNANANYVTPGATPYGTSFPSANVAIFQFIAYLYYNTTSTKVDIIGTANAGGSELRPFTDPQTAITFPFTYLNELKDTARTDFYNSGANKKKRTTYSHTVADGYGTLLLPESQTHTDVLRLRITSETIDSTFNTSDVYQSRSISIDTFYYWISESKKPHVFALSKNVIDGGPETIIAQYFTNPETTGIRKNKVSYVKLYPNPTTSEVVIELSETISLENVTFCLTEQTGKSNIVCQPVYSAKTTLSLTNLKQGTYLYTLQKGNEVLEGGKLVVE